MSIKTTLKCKGNKMKQIYFANLPVDPTEPEEENHTESGHGEPPPKG